MKSNGYSNLTEQLQSSSRRKKTIFGTLLMVVIYLFFALDIVTVKFNIPQQNYVETTDTNTPSEKAPDIHKCSETTASKLRSSEILWRKSVNQRHEMVGKKNLSGINPWDIQKSKIWWDYFYTSFNCPHQLERIGTAGDGGKWVCGLNLFEKYPRPKCVIYSFGISTESSFEAELHNRTDCEIFAYDFSVKKMGPQMGESSRVHFNSIGLGNTNVVKYRTLDSLMEENGHTWIDILKMDIEQAEINALEQIAQKFDVLPFGQLQLELHVMGIAFPTFYVWWEILEAKGLRAFMSEVNHYAAMRNRKPGWMEYSFINIRGDHLLLQ